MLVASDHARNHEKTGGGIVALYIVVFSTIGLNLRRIVQGTSKRVIYEEIPNTATLDELVDGIYLARMQCNLPLEYKLYSVFIRILRSPEILLHVTSSKLEADSKNDANRESLERPSLPFKSQTSGLPKEPERFGRRRGNVGESKKAGWGVIRNRTKTLGSESSAKNRASPKNRLARPIWKREDTMDNQTS